MSADVRVDSPRLILREFTPDDAQDVLAYASDPEVVKYMEPPNTEAQVRAYLDRVAEFRRAVPRYEFHFAVTLRQGGVIGGANLSSDGSLPLFPFFGVMLNRRCWRQGYAEEICAALFRFGFGELGSPRIGGACNAANAPSISLMTKLGFREYERVKFPWYEVVRFALDRAEWERRNSRRI